NDLAPAADHHLVDIGPDPDILMAEGNRHRVVVGLVAHQTLGRDAATVLVTGVERRDREGAHGNQITLQPLADRLALTAQDIVLALAASVLQPKIECLPPRELGKRHHEVAAAIAHQALDIPLVIAFARTAVVVPDQVMRQEAAEQDGPLAGAIGQDLRHQAPDRKSTRLNSSHVKISYA